MTKHSVMIVGAGLTGLSIAHLLAKKGINIKILEAQDRVGGRIQTLFEDGKAPVEMGATWVHAIPEWLDFLKEIGVELFDQDMGTKAWVDYGQQKMAIDIPPQEPMYRVAGGTHQIIEKLKTHLSDDTIQLGTKVSQIAQTEDGILVKTNQGELLADKVILTLPPKLLANTIQFQPELDMDYLHLASDCGTWMEYSTKFAIRFKEKFLNDVPYTMFSQSGLIQEMYDHTSADGKTFALKGFLNPRVLHWTQERRQASVLSELRSVYGDQFPIEFEYIDKIWVDDEFVSGRSFDYSPPKHRNGESLLRNAQWNDKLIFAGTETSPLYPGYMEGAFFSSIDTIRNHF